MSKFPKCCTFVRPLYGWFSHPWIFYHRPRTTSMDDLIIVRPWMTSLSSMGDFVVHESYSRSRTILSLLGWFLSPSALLDMDDPYGQIGDELISRYPIRSNNIIIKSSEQLRYFFFSFYSWNCFESIPFFLNFSFFSYFLDWISLFNSHSILFI